MKKQWYVLAIVCMAFASCDKDEDNEGSDTGFKVLEYRPAPGQFINEAMDCKTMEEANAYAEERLSQKQYVSLGAFGGYLTVRMPKVIKNRKGYDFGVIGNPFAGSSEPGIVWVSEDVNGNGKADDTWYELKGSDQPTRGYEVTYYRPDKAGAVAWEDNQGNEGEVAYLSQFHAQMYYPNWIKENSYTLKGSKLEDKITNNGEWHNEAFGWGYADNMSQKDVANDDNGNYRYNQFELDDAIEQDGSPVKLNQIHFVKVQSAILGNAGIIGEVSTEVVGFKVF